MRSVCLSSQHTLVYCLPPDEMSSIDDSFLPDKFRIALPTSDIDNAKNDSDIADQWSLDDTYPDELKQQKDMKKSKNDDDDVYRVPHSELTDSDDSAVGEGNPKNDETADTLAILKQLSDEMKIAHQQLDEIAIPKEDNVLADIAEEDEVSSPLPKPIINARGLFSCFADNTVVDVEQMNTKETDIPESDRIAAVSREEGGGRNLYEVRAPPGPLGILIDSSKDGPLIFSIKDESPLKHLVEPGDVILSVDGVDTKSMDAVAVANWISSKPSLAEQTLLMESKSQWNKHAITSSGDMSV